MGGNQLDTGTLMTAREEIADEDEPLFSHSDNKVTDNNGTRYIAPGETAAEILNLPIGSTPEIEVYRDRVVIHEVDDSAED